MGRGETTNVRNDLLWIKNVRIVYITKDFTAF